jgi:hypothetical protein
MLVIVNQPTRDDARRETARMEEREIQRDHAVRCGDYGGSQDKRSAVLDELDRKIEVICQEFKNRFKTP